MQTRFISEVAFKYDGTSLVPHWIFRTHGLLGDSIIAFIGEANVSVDHMVDLEDVRKVAPIYSPQMLHFQGEWFIDSLKEGILLQNLFVRNAYEWLWEQGEKELTRKGNDLFWKGRKLSVSIATRTPVSVLFHFGINIKTQGTPIPTSGLSEMGLPEDKMAVDLLEKFREDWQTWQTARVKVSPR